MNQNLIKKLESRGHIHPRSKDIPRAMSLLESAGSTVSVIPAMPLTEKTSTIIFREIYESIKQIGDAL